MKTLFLTTLLTGIAVLTQARPGVIEFSDGKTMEGNITLTPGKQLQLLDGTQARLFGLEQIREIRFAPEEETLERKWRFPEAGQTKKEITGKPFPVRHVKATILLPDNSALTGHLFTTVLYLEAKDETRKVILYAKQRGTEGQTLAQLTYPTRIQFTDDAGQAEARWKVQLNAPGITAATEVAGMSIGSLVRLNATSTEQSGAYEVAAPVGEEMFLGWRTGNNIVVGWPKNADDKIVARIRQGLTDAEDFFDQKELLGVHHDEPAGCVYSLLLLSRAGHTTMDGEKTQPWRVSVWRWKLDIETGQLMLAGRGDLFRDIIERGGALPSVRTSEKAWKPKPQNQCITIQADGN